MKKFLFLLLSLLTFGQDNVTVVGVSSKTTNTTLVENELVLSESSTSIKTPLTIELENYTHILIINYTYIHKWTNSLGPQSRIQSNKYGNRKLSDALSLSPLIVLDPYEVKKSKARKDSSFLKNMKDEKFLYLYIKEGFGRGDDINTTIIIRDYNNKTLYHSNHINVGLNQVLEPLIF